MPRLKAYMLATALLGLVLTSLDKIYFVFTH